MVGDIVVEVPGRGAIGAGGTVAQGIVAEGLDQVVGAVVANFGQATEGIISVFIGCGRTADLLDVSCTVADLVVAVIVLGDDLTVAGAEAVFELGQGVVRIPGELGVRPVGQGLLGQPPAGVVSEGDEIVSGRPDGGQPADGVVKIAGGAPVAVVESPSLPEVFSCKRAIWYDISTCEKRDYRRALLPLNL